MIAQSTQTRVQLIEGPASSWWRRDSSSGLRPEGEPGPPLDVPALIDGRYEVDGVLARGAMGAVLRAFDRRRSRWVALKRPLRARPDAYETLLREARTTRALAHSGVAEVYDISVDAEGVPYFTMELLEGRTLGALIEAMRAGRAARSQAWRVRVVRRIAEVLSHAHAMGYMHRDVKPDNVMVTCGGRVVVIDWGLATRCRRAEGGEPLPGAPEADITDDQTVAGTPIYMAPEALLGAVDPCTDVYSLSALLYELVTLEHYLPAPPESEFALLAEQIREAELVPADERCRAGQPTVPRAVAAVCARGLARDPGERFPSAEALRGALASALGRSRRRWASTLWVAVGAALLLTATVLLT